MSDPTPAPGGEYDQMLLLEDLESLYEEMEEIGVNSLDEVQNWLAAPATPQADHVALHAIRRLMAEYSVTSRAELVERIATLHAALDAVGT